MPDVRTRQPPRQHHPAPRRIQYGPHPLLSTHTLSGSGGIIYGGIVNKQDQKAGRKWDFSDLDAELAETAANTVPVMMPYIDAFFMPRNDTDRPKVVPEGAVNFAFLGQFAETARDTIFTTEYSMRTGMEAVYTLLNVDRGVPEVWGSTYDIRDLLDASVKLRDGKPLTDMSLNLIEKFALHKVLSKAQGTDIEKLLKEYHVI